MPDDYKKFLKDYSKYIKEMWYLHSINPIRTKEKHFQDKYGHLYVFSAEKERGLKPLSGSYFNNQINKTIQKVLQTKI